MRVEVLVPQIGEAVAELMLVAWHKGVGDDVEKGDLLFEIDSDKAIVEVDAFVDGTLTEIIEPDESAVLPQQVVAIIETSADTGHDMHRVEGPASNMPPPTLDADQKSRPIAKKEERGEYSKSKAQPKISPKARRLAKQTGIDWASISGSGAADMILVSDVEAAMRATSDGETYKG